MELWVIRHSGGGVHLEKILRVRHGNQILAGCVIKMP
ncbi:protein of unknown function [Methanoculleus bourgensis]|uniref:Uncharacterized protein n=1 Tax=Methanoculleus bourgensis TaxID=83986 RepID=A0A0X8XYK3_9EURY|nr:protein of unknown function [Methanoculleus bourgensis]